MKFFNYTNPKMIVANEGKHIRAKNDVYKEEYVNEEGEIVPEHFPYYTTIIFVPNSFTEEQMNEEYIEEYIDN